MVEETFYGIYEGESHQRHQGESRPDMTSRIDWGQERRGVGRETNKRGDKGREKSQEETRIPLTPWMGHNDPETSP